MTPDQGYLTTDDGVRLFFQRVGNGPKTIVIPNGFHLLNDFEQLSDAYTLIFYDLRNRGWSDPVSDASSLARGIHNDVDDLEAVRRHFGISQLDLIGHSYLGLMVILYAMKYPDSVNRVIQIGPMGPYTSKQYPANLTWADTALREMLSKLGELQKERSAHDPIEFCKKFWNILRVMYVSNPADADRINWGRCDLATERNFMMYWSESIYPSIQKLNFDDISKAQAPVLTIHGVEDRSAAYGGGREWATMLPHARLISVEKAGHAPWVEASELVFGSMRTFLTGSWPEAAEKVTTLEP
jgi:pimeloyl-ACP methyl ester carboxylesterase